MTPIGCTAAFTDTPISKVIIIDYGRQRPVGSYHQFSLPSDCEQGVDEPEGYIPAIRQLSSFTPPVISVTIEDDPEVELDDLIFLPMMIPNKVPHGPFVPMRKKYPPTTRNPPYIELTGDKLRR